MNEQCIARDPSTLCCPFCDEHPVVKSWPVVGMYFVKCMSIECSVQPEGKRVKDKAEAIRLWNIRHGGKS